MTKTLLFGGSGFFGPVILMYDKNIISVGRTKNHSSYCKKNKHIQIDNLDELNKLDELEFDKVILIGSPNHHEINLNIDMGIDFNVYPLNKALDYFSKKLKKFICFTTILLYDQKKLVIPVDETQDINPYANKYIFSNII